jgi:hypothetical protein
MINTCMLAQYTATGNTLGVGKSGSGRLTTKSVAIVAGKAPHSATEHITIQRLTLPSLSPSSALPLPLSLFLPDSVE